MTIPDEGLSKSDRKYRNQRRLIVEAARILFESQPYDDVSMDDIADQAALSKQTLYNYFSCKDAIYLGVGIENFRGSFERTDAIGLSSLTGKEQVLLLSEKYFDVPKTFPLNSEIARYFTIMNNQMNGIAEKILQNRTKKKMKREKKRSLGDFMADYLEQLWKYEEFWKKAIKKGRRDGSIRSKLTVDQLVYFIFAFLSGVVDQLQLKRIPLARAKLDHAGVRDITLKLIANLLEDN
jgi:AcrR family transcriptional regulator